MRLVGLLRGLGLQLLEQLAQPGTPACSGTEGGRRTTPAAPSALLGRLLGGFLGRVGRLGLLEDLLGEFDALRFAFPDAFPVNLVPSIATRPGRSTPARAQTASTWPNNCAIASSCCTRNRAVVAWSVCWLTAPTRNATSSIKRRSIRRLDRSPSA